MTDLFQRSPGFWTRRMKREISLEQYTADLRIGEKVLNSCLTGPSSFKKSIVLFDLSAIKDNPRRKMLVF